jgi:hypothetical protein
MAEKLAEEPVEVEEAVEEHLEFEESVLKKPRFCLSLSKRRKEISSSRFSVASDVELQSASKGVVPSNTAKNNAWAIRNFEEWVETKNNSVSETEARVPSDLLIKEWSSFFGWFALV